MTIITRINLITYRLACFQQFTILVHSYLSVSALRNIFAHSASAPVKTTVISCFPRQSKIKNSFYIARNVLYITKLPIGNKYTVLLGIVFKQLCVNKYNRVFHYFFYCVLCKYSDRGNKTSHLWRFKILLWIAFLRA